MKIRATLLLLLSLVVATSANAKEPTDAELDDWVNYLRSVGIPSTVKICSPVLQDEARVRSAADAWILANQASVDRGHALASTNPPKGSKSLDEYNAAMIKDYESKLEAMPAEEKLGVCNKYVELLEKRAKPQ
jgi:hypothetical protein